MGSKARDRATRRWARTGGAALLASLLAVPVVATPARAQPAEIGSAKAIAVVLKVAPTVGALELALGSGVAVSEVRNQLAQAQTTAVDLGLIGSTLTQDNCKGDPGRLKPSDLPQALRTDNRKGDSQAKSVEAPLAPGTLDGVTQIVTATKQPLSSADTTSAQMSFGKLIRVDGGRAVTTTEFRDGGATRVAKGSVTIDVNIPNVLQLNDLHWEALHETGKHKAATATFTIGSAKVLGQALPVDDVDQKTFFGLLNTALNPIGLTISRPVVERFTKPADFIRITPMKLVYSGTQGALLAPGFDLTRELRDGLAALAVAADCELATPFLLAEVGLGQVAGTGSTQISVGGAEAATGVEVLTNPFGNNTVLPNPPSAPVPATPGVPDTPPAFEDVVTPAAPTPAPETPQVQPIGSFEKVCESVHPFKWPACSAGAGPFVGLGALAATAALVAVDWRHQRKRRRPSTPEVTA